MGQVEMPASPPTHHGLADTISILYDDKPSRHGIAGNALATQREILWGATGNLSIAYTRRTVYNEERADAKASDGVELVDELAIGIVNEKAAALTVEQPVAIDVGHLDAIRFPIFKAYRLGEGVGLVVLKRSELLDYIPIGILEHEAVLGCAAVGGYVNLDSGAAHRRLLK